MKKTQNHSKFWSLLRQLPGVDLNDVNTCKDDYVWQSSNMLTTSLSEFLDKNPSGYKAMIANMHRTIASMRPQNNTDIKIYRSALLKRMQKYGIDTTDWTKVNGFLRQPKIAGKVMYDLTIDEIKALITKMESIMSKKDKERAEIKRLEQLN